MERRQILAILDGQFGALKDLCRWHVPEGIQPQLFYLAQLFCFAKSGVVLVVIVQAEQREDLIDGLYKRRIGFVSRVTRPRRYR